MSPKLSILGLLSTVVLFPIASQGAAIDYTFTDLGTLGGTDSQAFAVNESRQVAGVSSAIKGEVSLFTRPCGMVARRPTWLRRVGITATPSPSMMPAKWQGLPIPEKTFTPRSGMAPS